MLQLLEAAWCLTNIAAGKPEETKALLPALPLLVAHLGGWCKLLHSSLCLVTKFFIYFDSLVFVERFLY